MFKRYVYRNYRAFTSLKYHASRRVSVTGWVVLCAMLATAALGMDTTLSVAYQAFTFLLSLLIFSALAIKISGCRRLEVERVMPKVGSVGQPLRYRLIVRNQSQRNANGLSLIEDMPDPRPSFAEFVNTPEPGEEKRNWFDRTYAYYRFTWLMGQKTLAQVQEQALGDLPPRSSREIQAELLPLRRGVLKFIGATVICPEPFGIFRALRSIPLAESILILPKRYALPPFELPGKMKYQQGGVSMASSVGESEEFVSLREYRPGDPIRRLHWKSFAKLGKPIVKEFQEEFFVRHAMVLDTFSKKAFSDVFEEAVSVAASLAFTLQDHDSLLDLMFVGPQAFCFTSGRGVAHTEQMLGILASVQACQDKSFEVLEDLVFSHASQISGCVCIFLEWEKARQEFVRKLHVLGVPVLVFVIVENETTFDLGPMASHPQRFVQLPIGKVGEKLSSLRL